MKDELQFENKIKPRNLKENSILLPAVNSQRHLTKPLSRYGKEQNNFSFNESYFRKILDLLTTL